MRIELHLKQESVVRVQYIIVSDTQPLELLVQQLVFPVNQVHRVHHSLSNSSAPFNIVKRTPKTKCRSCVWYVVALVYVLRLGIVVFLRLLLLEASLVNQLIQAFLVVQVYVLYRKSVGLRHGTWLGFILIIIFSRLFN